LIGESEAAQRAFVLDLIERVVAQGALADLDQSAQRDEAVSAREAAMVVRARTVGVIADRAKTRAKAEESGSVVEMIPLHQQKVEGEEVEASPVVSVVVKASEVHGVLRTTRPTRRLRALCGLCR
jgi:hypothetical protein